LDNLSGILLGNVGNIVQAQLANINNALGTIVGFIQNTVIPILPQLTQTQTALVASVTSRLFSLQNLVSGLANNILGAVFPLLSQLEGALQGLLTPVLSTLISTLNQIVGCTTCLNGNGLLGILGRRRRLIA